ncbi:PLPL1 protein, partial [Asarcornis scutulata]|nr:PLPL1 protein [Asarcornis scutulata]
SFSLLLRGCSFMQVYEAGVLKALQELSPEILKSASKIYGASSGSILAASVLCECDMGKGYALPFILWLLSSRGKILHVLKDVLNKFLPVNAHQLVSGKLHVILTRVHDWRSVTVSEFATKEDLIQALLCSCFVPLFFGFLPPLYHGVRYVDGELGMWKANFTSQTMITVSAFAGEYDICPKDCPAAFFNFQISDCIFQISKKNIYRFLCIL